MYSSPGMPTGHGRSQSSSTIATRCGMASPIRLRWKPSAFPATSNVVTWTVVSVIP